MLYPKPRRGRLSQDSTRQMLRQEPALPHLQSAVLRSVPRIS